MGRSKRWKDLSGRQRRLLSVGGLVQFALLVAALRDLRSRSDDEINGSRRVWRLAVFVNYLGPLLYFWRGRRTT